MSKDRLTNQELIKTIATLNPLSELLVISAIEQYAMQVKAEEEGWGKNHLINWEAWKDTANQTLHCLEYHRG
jgi:hypothetical protein